jgi:signal transduction histidine kinase
MSPSAAFRRWWPEFALAIVIVVSVVAIVVGTWGETIPFHVVWVSFGLVYGFRLWSTGWTIAAFLAITAASGAALASAVLGEDAGPGVDELAEVPFMALVFLVMMGHVRYRLRAADEMGEALELRERMLGSQRDFVRGVSHALRTPITIARGHAELLQTGHGHAGDTTVVLEELDRLSRLSDRLLAIVAAEGADPQVFRPVSLDDVMDGLARRWASVTDRRWTISSVGGWVPADRDRLDMALDAIIENAVKYSDPGSAIRVSLTVRGRFAEFAVEDEGPGIAPEDRERVFEPFFRSERAAERRGTGLGLPVVRAVALAHGGTVEADVSPAGGARIRLALPGWRSALQGPAGERAGLVRAPA